MPHTEQELIELLPTLRRLARLLCNCPNKADDVVATSLTYAFSQSSPSSNDLKLWLLTVVCSVYRDRMPEIGCGGGTRSPRSGDPLHEAFARLPRRQRECLALVNVLGITPAEAAAITGESESAVRVQMHAGRHRLRVAMEELKHANLS